MKTIETNQPDELTIAHAGTCTARFDPDEDPIDSDPPSLPGSDGDPIYDRARKHRCIVECDSCRRSFITGDDRTRCLVCISRYAQDAVIVQGMIADFYACLGCGDTLPRGRGGHCDACTEWGHDR